MTTLSVSLTYKLRLSVAMARRNIVKFFIRIVTCTLMNSLLSRLKIRFCLIHCLIEHRLWRSNVLACSIKLYNPKEIFFGYLKLVFFLIVSSHSFLKHVIEISQSSIMHNKKQPSYKNIFFYYTQRVEFFFVLALLKKCSWKRPKDVVKYVRATKRNIIQRRTFWVPFRL